MEHGRDDTDKGKPKKSDKKILSRYQFVHRKSYTDWCWNWNPTPALYSAVYCDLPKVAVRLDFAWVRRLSTVSITPHTPSAQISFISDQIQGDSAGMFKILGGDSIGHCDKERSYEIVSSSEWLPKTELAFANDSVFNLLEPELFFLILAHPVYKIWIIQETNTLELWNKLHFEEEKTESIYRV